MKTIILNWFGPYAFDEVLQDKESGNGIYLVTGKRPYERTAKIQYCGITENSFAYRLKTHHKIHEVTKDRRFWLAQIEYPVEFNREILETAEKIIIYAWQYDLNEKKKYTPPQPTTIINFWFKKDYTPRFNQMEIYKDFTDVLSWNGDFWRTGNLKVIQNAI
jgi:hypothetical protein